MWLPVNSGKYRQRQFSVWTMIVAGFFALMLLSGCGRRWETLVVSPDGTTVSVNREVLESLSEYADEDGNLSLERVLWHTRHSLIEKLTITEPDGSLHEFQWDAVAEEATWLKSGLINIKGESYRVSQLEGESPVLINQVEMGITDIAPIVLTALGLEEKEPDNWPVDVPQISRVALIFLDGFGYVRYREAIQAELIPNLATLPQPYIGLTEYPPSTRVGTAALLTGKSSRINGVDGRAVRNTNLETLFDKISAAGQDVIAVEGDALAFNLRSAEIQLSGDRDGNGSTDDNVLVNALAVIEEGVPDLFYVHFHGIDDAGHTYGPGAPEEKAAIQTVDAAVGQILRALPADTYVIIFADHGMHSVGEEGRLGNHGHLIERDMLIPIFITLTD